jgi:tetratricopeptide (TPR) repeat protein
MPPDLPRSEWHRVRRLALAVVILASAAVHPLSAQQRTTADAARLSAQADEARLSNRSDEAIALYRKALAARPAWAEGWWHLGTLLYDRDAFADGAVAFRKATTLDPKVGTAWVMRGLCEFRLGHRDEALAYIQRGRRLGISPDPQFRRVMLYHEGVLLLGKGEFERAQETLALLSADGVENDDLAVALGMSVLRVAPSELADGESVDRERVRRAGLAESLAARKQLDEAQREYERLTADFPAITNVFYALGRFLVATSHPEQAAAAYRREIENSPDHVPARIGLAAILAETDPAAALPYAEEAVRLNPRIPLGHYVLGSILLHTDQTSRAIAELEAAERSVKDDPGVYYALGRAYTRAGRPQDAARARAVFKRLTEERQRAARRGPDKGDEP